MNNYSTNYYVGLLVYLLLPRSGFEVAASWCRQYFHFRLPNRVWNTCKRPILFCSESWQPATWGYGFPLDYLKISLLLSSREPARKISMYHIWSAHAFTNCATFRPLIGYLFKFHIRFLPFGDCFETLWRLFTAQGQCGRSTRQALLQLNLLYQRCLLATSEGLASWRFISP